MDEKVHQYLVKDSRTVLAIVHRIQNVPSFDRVVVIRDGYVHEEGPPHQLLRDPNSLLSQYYSSHHQLPSSS